MSPPEAVRLPSFQEGFGSVLAGPNIQQPNLQRALPTRSDAHRLQNGDHLTNPGYANGYAHSLSSSDSCQSFGDSIASSSRQSSITTTKSARRRSKRDPNPPYCRPTSVSSPTNSHGPCLGCGAVRTCNSQKLCKTRKEAGSREEQARAMHDMEDSLYAFQILDKVNAKDQTAGNGNKAGLVHNKNHILTVWNAVSIHMMNKSWQEAVEGGKLDEWLIEYSQIGNQALENTGPTDLLAGVTVAHDIPEDVCHREATSKSKRCVTHDTDDWTLCRRSRRSQPVAAVRERIRAGIAPTPGRRTTSSRRSNSGA